MLTRLQAKRILKRKGYSYRDAAPLLHVHFVHLSMVLNGHRTSKCLIKKINALPPKEEVSS